jgi:acyl dehydratase
MAVQELESAPNLLALYGKAVLSGFARRGGALPDTGYELPHVPVDAEKLAAYNRVCGFRLTGELPGTYPHILSFPLQIKLMTGPGFPFPLIGSVHLANKITQLRPLRADERLGLRVRAANLRDHPKGRQFDVISEALGSTAGGTNEVVWTGVSTYLRRGGGSGEEGDKGERPPPPEPTGLWHVPGDIGRRYAEVSGDRNPIHLHPLTARLLGFRRAIAHGMWTKARCLAAFEGRLPDAYTVDVRFKLPVLLPARVGFATRPTEDGWGFDLVDARTGKPHLAGTISAAAT